jgi:hypothetical protein
MSLSPSAFTEKLGCGMVSAASMWVPPSAVLESNAT